MVISSPSDYDNQSPSRPQKVHKVSIVYSYHSPLQPNPLDRYPLALPRAGLAQRLILHWGDMTAMREFTGKVHGRSLVLRGTWYDGLSEVEETWQCTRKQLLGAEPMSVTELSFGVPGCIFRSPKNVTFTPLDHQA
jgi:hypothetical protein